MYIARVPNRKSPPTILLRESWREGARVKNRTLANLTHWPADKRALRSETAHSSLGEQLRLDAVDEDDLYAAMDWLVP